MTSSLQKTVVPLLLVATMGAFSPAQTVLYDFDSPLPSPEENDPFGHFGGITITSSTNDGVLADCGTPGNFCATHTGRFTALVTSPNEFGMVEIGPHENLVEVPPYLDLTGFDGYSIDARFIRDTDGLGGAGLEVFTGLSPIKFGLQWDPNDVCNGSMNQCSDLYDEPVELTETFQTFTVMFDDFLQGKPRNSAQIKMLMLTGVIDPDTGVKAPGSDWSDGFGRLEFDNIIGILPAAGVAGDYNDNGVVDAADYTVWLDTLGSTSDLAANGDDTGGSMGVIDQADYDFWKANFGNITSAGSGAAIPEPGTLGLVVMVSGFALIFGWRRE